VPIMENGVIVGSKGYTLVPDKLIGTAAATTRVLNSPGLQNIPAEVTGKCGLFLYRFDFDPGRNFKNRTDIVSDDHDDAAFGPVTGAVQRKLPRGHHGFFLGCFDIRKFAAIVVDGRSAVIEVEVEAWHSPRMQGVALRS
jgi:hypothetical protein